MRAKVKSFAKRLESFLSVRRQSQLPNRSREGIVGTGLNLARIAICRQIKRVDRIPA